MFETKYLIIIGVILCLLVIYYFYDEISNIKRTFLPTYQKTMALEAKLLEYEKQYGKSKSKSPSIRTKSKSKSESPIMSITYISADAKNNPDGTSSVQYANITEHEAKELLGVLNKDNKNTINPPELVRLPKAVTYPENLDTEVICDIKTKSTQDVTIVSDSIQIKTPVFEFNNEKLDYSNIWNAINNITDDLHYSLQNKKHDSNKYTDMELDLNVIKSISDSVHKVDLPIEETYSDIPISKINEYKAKHKKR